MNLRLRDSAVRTATSAIAAAIPILALAALLLVDPTRAWNHQLGRWAAGVAPPAVGIGPDFLLLAAAFAAVFALAGRRRLAAPALLLAILLAGQAACLARAWPSVAGTLPWGVDHGAFLYRIREYREAFPALGSYNPLWNAGTEHFVGVTSGAHGFALLNAPLLLLFRDPARWYGPALAFWLFLGFPWLAALALRRCGARWASALCAALLLLAATRAQFLFFWQSGNLGGLVAAGLATPLAALGYRAAVLRRCPAPDLAALALCAWLSCIWPPGVFTCAGLFLGWLANPGRWTRRSFVRLIAAGAAALLLLSPWLWAELFPMRGIAQYATTAVAPEPFSRRLGTGLGQLGRRLLEWHPAILAFGLGGSLLAAPRRMRRFLLPALALLLAVAASVGFKRNSQLDRVAIQAAFLAAFPAAVLLGRLLSRAPSGGAARRAAIALARGASLSALALGAWRVAPAHAGNAAGFKLWTAEPVVFEFADWVRENVPEGARLAFSGETDCKLDWGKGTYLPVLAGREMMSDDYYGYPKGLTERNYPPRHYRRSTEAFLFFSRAYGITHWAVTDPRTRRFCEEEAEHFRLAARFQMQSTDVRVYEIADPDAAAPTRLLEGSGEVSARENRIVVRPSDPAAERLVLRYNWRDGLRCLTPGATIEPYAVDDKLRFVAVRPNGAREVEIGYRPLWRPLPPNFDGRYHH